LVERIALVSDGRMSHGIYLPIMQELSDVQCLDYVYFLTGMHFLEEFGFTRTQIEKESIEGRVIDLPDFEGTEASRIAHFISLFDYEFKKQSIDLLLAQGDRSIELAAVIAATYSNISVAHIHGGEVSGTIDEITRHAITKLSHCHFASTIESGYRLKKMGEKEDSIFIVGAPAVDFIKQRKLLSRNEVERKLDLELNEPYLVTLYNPDDSNEKVVHENYRQVIKTLEAIDDVSIVLIYPNNDVGCQEIINQLIQFNERNQARTRVFKSLPYIDYLSTLKYAKCLIGNSSGGIIEAPTLGIPNICVGPRQNGREKAVSCVTVGAVSDLILDAYTRQISENTMKEACDSRISPYEPNSGTGVAKSIINAILSVDFKKLQDKKITY
jgi:GDP/UDP-N,N'-diacetylbacillosamine 2-epimerase (hydrolysing)